MSAAIAGSDTTNFDSEFATLSSNLIIWRESVQAIRANAQKVLQLKALSNASENTITLFFISLKLRREYEFD